MRSLHTPPPGQRGCPPCREAGTGAPVSRRRAFPGLTSTACTCPPALASQRAECASPALSAPLLFVQARVPSEVSAGRYALLQAPLSRRSSLRVHCAIPETMSGGLL